MSLSANEVSVSGMCQARALRYVGIFGIICFAASLVLLSGCSRKIPSVDSWKEYKLGGGKFGAKFPFEPKKNVETKPLPGFGNLNIELHQLEISRTYALVSSFTKLPSVGAYDVDEGLQLAVQGAAQNSGSSVQSTKILPRTASKGGKLTSVIPKALSCVRGFTSQIKLMVQKFTKPSSSHPKSRFSTMKSRPPF